MTDAPDTGDGLGSLILFALVASVTIGATLTGFRIREWLREKEQDREVGL
jgi:hypothetical protein